MILVKNENIENSKSQGEKQKENINNMENQITMIKIIKK